MPTILFDHTDSQFRRWLLHNSPIIPWAIIVGATLVYCPNLTTQFVLLAFSILFIVVFVWGAIFHRIILFEEKEQIVWEYRFLSLFTVGRKVEAISECTTVRYHTWQQPYGHHRISYHAAIYLHFKNRRPWRISDQCHHSMDVECDEFMAEQLARALMIPMERVKNDPLRAR